MIVLGIDPGLRRTGWGAVDVQGTRVRLVACGVVTPVVDGPLAVRLADLYHGLEAVLKDLKPDTCAVEETFVNKNPLSTLKLGHARGVALLVPALNNVPVFEYAPNTIKKSVVGVGHASKSQIQAMIVRFFPDARAASEDAADALAIAMCHAHHASARVPCHS